MGITCQSRIACGNEPKIGVEAIHADAGEVAYFLQAFLGRAIHP
jgi:hypothetical protein